MVLDKVLELFKKKVFSVAFNDGFCNPYSSVMPGLDLPSADEIRRENLRKYVLSISERPSTIIIGEAPGWRGCRFSGVPFTSEYQLCNGWLPFEGRQSSNKDVPYKESTATVFWEVMRKFHSKFLAWNCIPFHPFRMEDPLSNRTPTKQEILTYSALLSNVIDLVKPLYIVAVGRSAERSLKNLDIPCSYVRHPSHGGKNEFREGMNKIFSSNLDGR